MLLSLRTHAFRCLSDAELEFPPGVSFFTGPNGSGKTSLLEAVCVLLRLQSPRTSKLAHCTRFHALAWSLKGTWQPPATSAPPSPPRLLRVVWHSQEGRHVSLDDKTLPSTETYLSLARVTWFANTDLALVKGTSAARRRFLDFLCAQLDASYLAHLRAYERALRARNLLLKQGRSRRQIEALSEPLTQAGQPVSERRREALARVLPEFQRAALEIGAEAQASLCDEPGHQGHLAQALADSMPADLAARVTTRGPHRDDFTVLLGGQPAAFFGSEGQQRTLALALKLAQARLLRSLASSAPVLLVDDIFGELDPSRRNRFLQALPQDSQVFITTSFLTWKTATEPATLWRVENGRIFREIPPH